MKEKVIYQLGFKIDKIPNLPIVDCRIIQNPFTKYLTDEARIKAVREDKRFSRLVEEAIALLDTEDEIVIACSWGRHRSGAVAREVALRTGADIRKGAQKR